MDSLRAIIYSCLLLLLSNFNTQLIAQEKVSLKGTNLKISLKEGFDLIENTASITNNKYTIAFMEISGEDFYEERGSLEDIGEKFSQKGIIVNKNQRGKIGNYEAHFIFPQTVPSTYLVFFGNKYFSACAYITAADSLTEIDETEVNSVLETVEYKER